MAALMVARWPAALQRWLPDTLFGRLALLLIVAVIVSHVLALTLMFELRPAHPGHPPGPQPLGVAADGQSLPLPPPGPGQGLWNAPPSLQLGLLLDISVRLAALVAVAWWAARWLSRPMHRLATAAQELGRDIDRPPLPEDGTLECPDASRGINQMQARTRAQQLFRRDIAEMDATIASTLDYLRGVAGAEAWVLLDVQALVDSMADDQLAMGHRVTVAGQAAPLRVQAVALRRCLDNLVGNAIRYGGSAEVTLHDAVDALTIEVRDHGPGLPAEELERVMEPFYRVEASRNRQSGGAGLG